MENSDFIWFACSCCPQEAADAEWKGKYCLKSCFCRFLVLPASLLTWGWLWLSALHRGAGELPEKPAPMGALGNLVWFLSSSGALG